MLKYHIQTVDLASAQGSITFNSIPQDYTDLYILYSTRSVVDNPFITWTGFNVRANGIAAGYSGRMLEGNGSSAYSQTNNVDSQWDYAASPDSATTANTFSNGAIHIPNYSGSTPKSYSMDRVTENNASQSSQLIYAGLLNTTQPITSLSFVGGEGNFAAGSTISLYGVRRGDSKETATATGGIVTTSGGYTIHTFNTSGTFTVSRNIEAEYIVIAGGAGGGGGTNASGLRAGGAGGAGGYRSSVAGESSGGGASAESKLTLTAGSSHTVTVGAGGSGGSSSTQGTSGSNSEFSSITATGGGGGGRAGGNFAGTSGGSGGGGGSDTGAGGAGTSGQGFAGGASGGTGTGQNTGGGGGGAGSVGSAGTSNYQGGTGGAGVSSSITGTSIPRAGGGGGGSSETAIGGIAGPGGGNGGTSNTNGLNATANTGSGGGGAGMFTTTATSGGAGGSGVVIIRYLTP